MIITTGFCEGTAQEPGGLLKPERIYIHTDRDVYVAGDYLFYSAYLQGDYRAMSRYAYLVLRGRHNSVIAQERLEIDNRKAFGSIYLPDTLSSDVYQIVCYTNCMRNGDEVNYFKKEIIIANKFDEHLIPFDETFNTSRPDVSSAQSPDDTAGSKSLIIRLDKRVFNPREKISLSIQSGDIPGKSVAHLSVSISEIVPGIAVGSSISEYFRKMNVNARVKEHGPNSCNYYPETDEPVLQGRVLPARQSGSREDSINKNNGVYTILVSSPDSVVNMQYARTDSLGFFRLLLSRFYNGKGLFIRIKENVDATIVPDNKFNLIEPFMPSGQFNVRGIRAYLTRSQNISLVRRNYSELIAIDTIRRFLPSNAIPRVYYKHYSSILPADYVELNDFAEISKEIIPALRVRKSNGSYFSNYVTIPAQAQESTGPEIFLDGVPIDDVNQIIPLGSSRIKRIETLPVIRYYGDLSLNGILAVFSKGLFINNIEFKTPTLKYLALSSQPYTRPDYSEPAKDDKRIPDLRQLLLWKPDIIIYRSKELNIECSASDLQGKYMISVQGITSEGDPVSGSAIITIRSKSN